MKCASRLWESCSACSLLGTTGLVVSVGVLCFGLMPSEGAHNTASATRALNAVTLGSVKVPNKLDPAAVAGSKSCVECHKSELDALMQSKHHKSLDKIKGLGNAKVIAYATAVGIKPADVMKSSLCVGCHGTLQGKAGKVTAISGVSCESCHGGASGNPEWLKLHAVKGAAGRKARQLACDKAGMIRAANLYEIARNCFECHIVFDQALVNAGHSAANGLELAGWSTGEMRHNFQIDQKVNAAAPSLWMKLTGGTAAERRNQKFVVGILVDLELTLSNLAKVPAGGGRKPFAKGHAKRLKSTAKVLEDVVKALGDGAPKEIVDARNAIKKMGRISSINFKSQEQAEKAAPIVAKSARSFAETGDASALGALTSLVKKKAKPKGKAHSP